MSLLGTVLDCERETVRLRLDIDAGCQEHNSYAWKWAPTTGNVMYMMPQTGTRVSLYFKGEEETSAMAVNCIRNGGGCAGADYRNKTLKTEHGMQLQLNQEDVEIITLKNKVMLDDLNGINISGSGTLHVMAIGNVEIQGEAVTLFGNEGIELYEGKVNADGSVSVKAMITLTADGGEANMDVRGAAKTCYLAWEHGDLSDPSYRYRDAPDRRDYDYNQLATNVIAGVAVSLSLGVVAGVGGLMVAGSTTLGVSVAVGGTWYVGMQAVTDVLGGRVSSTDAYLRKALAGGAVGFFSGAASLAMAGAGLGQTMGIAFAEGALGSAVSQQILEEEIDWTRVIVDGAFSSVMEGVLWKVRNPGGVTEGPGNFNDWLMREGIDPDNIPMNPEQFQRIKEAFEARGGLIIQDADAQALLNYSGAQAATLDGETILLRPNPTASDVFEELIHSTQYKNGTIVDLSNPQTTVYAEIEAAEKLIRNRAAYNIPNNQTIDTIKRTQGLINDYNTLNMDNTYLEELINKIQQYANEFDITIHK